MGQSKPETELKMVWMGLVYENVDSHESHLRDIGVYLGLNQHTTVFAWRKRWEALDWRTRYGWLILFDGFRANGVPIRESIAEISEFIDSNFSAVGS